MKKGEKKRNKKRRRTGRKRGRKRRRTKYSRSKCFNCFIISINCVKYSIGITPKLPEQVLHILKIDAAISLIGGGASPV